MPIIATRLVVAVHLPNDFFVVEQSVSYGFSSKGTPARSFTVLILLFIATFIF